MNREADSPVPVIRRHLKSAVKRCCQALGLLVVAIAGALALFNFVNPPVTPMIAAEYFRLGSVDRQWLSMEEVPAHFRRSLVAAEDTNFCRHWGFDLDAIRISSGTVGAGATISQQTARNLLLWRANSWFLRVVEAPIALLIEALWSKQRILEVYMNIVAYDEGVFGVQAGALRHFGKEAAALDEEESARLAILIPDPVQRKPFDLPDALEKRVVSIQDGAATIRNDGRFSCLGS